MDSTDSYRKAILAAANLGDDADTTAAICGQVAGAYCGEHGIPQEWLDRLALRKTIRQLAEDLYDLSQSRYCALSWWQRAKEEVFLVPYRSLEARQLAGW